MNYTREAGVRGLERRIGDICRKCAKKVMSSNVKNIKITEKNLEKYLGKPRYTFDLANTKDEIGVVRGTGLDQRGRRHPFCGSEWSFPVQESLS